MLQETKMNENKCFTSDNYKWFVATSVTSTEREKAQRLRDNGETVPEHILTAAAEHRGVGFAIHNNITNSFPQLTLYKLFLGELQLQL